MGRHMQYVYRRPKGMWSDYLGRRTTVCNQHTIIDLITVHSMFPPKSNKGSETSVGEYRVAGHLQWVKAESRNRVRVGYVRILKVQGHFARARCHRKLEHGYIQNRNECRTSLASVNQNGLGIGSTGSRGQERSQQTDWKRLDFVEYSEGNEGGFRYEDQK